MTHLTPQQLLSYAAERMASFEQEHADSHLAVCGLCRNRASALLYLKYNFDHLWNNWDAGSMIAFLESENVVPSLLSKLIAHADASVRVVIDHGRRVANQIAIELADGLTMELRPLIAGVGSGEDDLAFDEHVSRSGVLLAQNRVEESLAELEQAAAFNAYATQTSSAMLLRQGVKSLEIQADSRRQRITVRCWPNTDAASPDYVIAVPGEAGGRLQCVPFRPVEDEEYLVATIENIPDGECGILFASLSTVQAGRE